jgi:hypothetical protein
LAGLYSLNSPERLFDKLVSSFTKFCDSPSEDGIFEVIFPLYHLREWICPGGHESYKGKPEVDRTQEEILHAYLYGMPEYKAVQELCNRTKHYNNLNAAIQTEVLQGFRCGLARAGDSLGITHFMVDGTEIRDIFWPVYQVYFSYFRRT